ncbi:MAG: hypothetical protein Q9179_001888, partial [Wetmoreana sp. 5 TL-2023]
MRDKYHSSLPDRAALLPCEVMTLPSLVAFGAVAPWPGTDRLDEIRNALHQHATLEPAIAAIEELPSLWKVLSKQDPRLSCVAGGAAADQLAQWIGAAGVAQLVQDKGNVTRMPLTIMTQIAQYIGYLRQCDEPLDHKSIIESAAAGGGFQGFCIGLLSALAVASGKTEDDVGIFAAASMRLAFCVSAYVDLDRHCIGDDCQVSNLAVRWKAPTTLEDIQSLLSKHPDTYIAVVRDVRDITIAVPASGMERLLEDLLKASTLVRDTGISGRCHITTYKGASRKILEACPAHFRPTLDDHALVRSNTDTQLMCGEDTALFALESILEERADWYSTMSIAASALNQISPRPFILSIGTDAVPQSVAKSFPVVKSSIIANRVAGNTESETPALAPGHETAIVQGYPEDAIAVIGMACRFAGADSIDAFWDLLTEGKAMLSEVPEARFGRRRPVRSNSSLRVWGNFIRDVENFDHGFFKISPREAVFMDPQQRILLEVAYEALESSGYFTESPKPKNVGCYIGACAVDYDFNVASHPPSAYSATGTLRSFLSGKLSYYFGWSGPSLVLDTACSSSAVAIYTACTALKTRQCSQAVAGGITLMTSPYLYEKFSAAHFLSPAGGSKPFSADADGYGRGEGGGIVVLKRLSDALRDNDHIFGVIAGSAVNQNDNCVPITVPHTSSQRSLYEQVTRQAGVTPSMVNFVEAHGTGTPVGDPIEMESIRHVFGGPDRASPLIVSSAKGNIGHTEGASGVAALIKAVLQMEHRLAPRQAFFKTLNPRIPAFEADNLCIPMSNLALSGERMAACINNYGAAGSNAAMILLEAPRIGTNYQRSSQTRTFSRPAKYPIQLAAASAGSLLTYCMVLTKFCDRLRSVQNAGEQSQMLSNLAFSLATRLNQELPFIFISSIGSSDQLQAQLRQQTVTGSTIKQRPKEPPLILCFGGQVSDKVALDKGLWQESALLRSHLDICDNTLRAMGYPGLYPGIFQNEPVNDVVVLHSIIFATQYSCAKAWLESGLKVDALVGHSFGQLTALCVSGTLSLPDGLRLVAGRASLMQKYWGPESGTMIAIEIDQQSLEEIREAIYASNADFNFEIACFNGSTSHVAVSDKVSAGELATKLNERGIRHRRLDVQYGFHSRFTEPLLPYLGALASSLTFGEPIVHFETCTNKESWTKPTAKHITTHTREPVFFGQAVQRLEANFGPCTWLEAGSDSSIVNMVRRALGQYKATANNFVSVQLNKPNSTEHIVDATVALWNASHRLQFWNFHRLQRLQYEHLHLPPYAWEKSRKWLELDMSSALNSMGTTDIPPATDTIAQAKPLPVFIRLVSTDSHGHHFIIDQSSDEYQTLIKGVKSMGSATWPSTLCLELASRAVRVVDEGQRHGVLTIKEFQVRSFLEPNAYEVISVDIQRLAGGWKFRIAGIDGSSNSPEFRDVMCHAEGIIDLGAADCCLNEEFCRYERLTGHDRIAIIADDPRSESLRGNVIYKMLARAIIYPDWYRAVKSVAAVDSRVVARVKRPAGIPEIVSKNTTTQLPILESFMQVASLHVNCLREGSGGEVFRFARADYLQWAPSFEDHGHQTSGEVSWDVVAYSSSNAREVTYDMFIYDAVTTRLVLLMLGVRLTNVRQPVTIPAGLNSNWAPAEDMPALGDADAENANVGPPDEPFPISRPQLDRSRPKKHAKMSIYQDICHLLEKLADIPGDQVSGDQTFDDIGVDSLMMIEVISELSTLFRVDLPIHELEALSDIDSLVTYLHGKGCVGSSYEEGGDALLSPSRGQIRAVPAVSDTTSSQSLEMGPYGFQDLFLRLRFDFQKHAEQVGADGFWNKVYPEQADLVCAYVVDAYRQLGCDLASLAAGQPLPSVEVLPKHRHLLTQLSNILVDSGLLDVFGLGSNQAFVRTAKTLDLTSTAIGYERIRAAVLTVRRQAPSRTASQLYADSRLVKAATRLLADFMGSVFSATQSDGILRILEVGAGTGATTKNLVELLNRCGVSFEYFFTDISQSLVSQAKRTFSGVPQMRFLSFDCNRPAPPELLERFHIVISTNCIHATSNITTSTAKILPTLRKDGVLCLVEFTRNLYWFDLVFGLLEGWWSFSDGRQHALAEEWFRDSSLPAAGFKHVSWTDGNTEEAKTLRLICAFKGEARVDRNLASPPRKLTKRAGVPMEEIVWKR